MFRNLNTGAIGVKTSLEEACRLARKYGFSGVDVSASDVERLGTDGVQTLLEEHALEIGVYILPGRWFQDEDQWKQGLRSLPRLLGLGRQIGANRTFNVISSSSDPRQFGKLPFSPPKAEPVARVMEDYGFRWGFEFLGPHVSTETKVQFRF